MRRSPLVLFSSLALLAALTGCANGSTSSKGASASPTPGKTSTVTTAPAAASGAPAATATVPSTAPSAGPSAGTAPTAAATTGPALPAGTTLPTASGSYGDKPVLTFPKTTGPPKTLLTKVLHQGTGPVVAKNDLLVADYLGQIWGGAVFDNSYDRKAPTGFTIGAGQVIPGWDSTLVGIKAGTRIEMSVPPAEGYGASGQPQAGIKPTDTLVFVVDVIASFDKTAAADPHAVAQTLPAAGPQVSGALTGPPTVTIPSGLAEPTKDSAVIVDKGTGKPVTTGTIVVQYIVQSWAGQAVDSTWTTGTPAAFPVGSADPTVFDQLKGIPVGSRVLMEIPAQTQAATASASASSEPAVAVVADIVAEVPTAKASVS